MATTFALQSVDGAGRWATCRPVFTCTLAGALYRLRLVGGALPLIPLRIVDAATMRVVAVSHPSLLPAAGELQPNIPRPEWLQ